MSIVPDHQVLVEKIRGVGYITLNRPAALNTINLPMVRTIYSALRQWSLDNEVRVVVIKGNGEKAFCAGGDVRRVYECLKENSREYEDFFTEEFVLDEYIYSYPKPCIALMHGIVMGGGMGLSQGAKFRVICENTKVAMPETAIGYFPDVGASYFLNRTNQSLATYLGVTGKLLTPEDTLFCGLADWILPASQWNLFAKKIEGIQSPPNNQIGISDHILSILKDLGASNDTRNSEIAKNIKSIERVFSATNLPQVYEFLQCDPADTWCVETLEGMKKNSPLAMAVSLQLLRQGSSLTIEQAFSVELEINFIWKTKGEFIEGVRAALVDKDKKPIWTYTLNDINSDFLKSTFPPLFKH